MGVVVPLPVLPILPVEDDDEMWDDDSEEEAA